MSWSSYKRFISHSSSRHPSCHVASGDGRAWGPWWGGGEAVRFQGGPPGPCRVHGAGGPSDARTVEPDRQGPRAGDGRAAGRGGRRGSAEGGVRETRRAQRGAGVGGGRVVSQHRVSAAPSSSRLDDLAQDRAARTAGSPPQGLAPPGRATRVWSITGPAALSGVGLGLPC